MLQDTINSISDEDVLIVVGDWNARVGSTDHDRSNTDSSYVGRCAGISWCGQEE